MAGRNGREPVEAGVVRFGVEREVGINVDKRDVRLRNGGSGGISDRAADNGAAALGEGGKT